MASNISNVIIKASDNNDMDEDYNLFFCYPWLSTSRADIYYKTVHSPPVVTFVVDRGKVSLRLFGNRWRQSPFSRFLMKLMGYSCYS